MDADFLIDNADRVYTCRGPRRGAARRSATPASSSALDRRVRADGSSPSGRAADVRDAVTLAA